MASIALGTSAAIASIECTLRFLVAPECFGQDLPNFPGRYRFRTAHVDVGVYINRLGLRGPEIDIEKSPGTVRILCIGDSTTWGESVEWPDTYPIVAHEQLSRGNTGTRIEFVNMSRPGAGLVAYHEFWTSLGRRLQPDVVVIGFFLGNDMFSVRNPYAVVAPKPTQTQTMSEWAASRLEYRARVMDMVWSRWIGSEIDIFDLWFGTTAADRARNNPMLVDNLVSRGAIEGLSAATVRQRLEAMPEGLVEGAMQHRVDPWLLSAAVLHPQSIRESETDGLPHIEAAWHDALRVLDAMLDDVRACGAQTALLVIPRAVHVDSRYGAEFAQLGFDIPSGITQSSLSVDRLTRHLADTNTTVVNPLPVMRELASRSSERLYFPFDVHLTAAGNRILGTELAHRLSDMLPR